MKSVILTNQLTQITFLLILVFLSGSAIAADEIEVKITYRSGLPTTQYYDSSEAINLTVDDNWERINIVAVGAVSGKHIGRITLSGDTDRRLYVILGTGVWTGDGELTPNAGDDWGGITVDSEWEDYVWFEGKIAGDLLDSVRVGLMANFSLDSSVLAPITTTAANDEDVQFLLEVGTAIDLDAGEKIWTKYQDIGYIQVINGDLDGEILADNGQIWHPNMAHTGVSVGDGSVLGNITAGRGRISKVSATHDIGTSGNPVTITATGTNSDDMGNGKASPLWSGAASGKRYAYKD